MPEDIVTVDQAVINSKIDALRTLLREHEGKIEVINNTITCLELIRHYKGAYKKDQRTDATLTDAEAEEIYTLWVPKATELLT